MARRLTILLLLLAAPLALAAAACGSDDGSGVREVGTDGSASASGSGSASGSSASGSGSGSGSASGTGLSLEDTQTAGTGDEAVAAGVAAYTGYVEAQVDETIADTKAFTDAVRAGNLQAARAAYAPSREGWERIEPIAGLVEAIDGAVDARVDDFAGPNDPEFTGWHRLEYLLWKQNTTEGAARFANRLDRDLQTLKTELATLEIPPAAVALGASELIEEVSAGKITGEEDRYSKTDLWDFNANVEGAEQVIAALAPALEAADPGLLQSIETGFDEIEGSLEPLRQGDGWVLFCQENDEYPSSLCPGTTVTQEQIDTMKAQLASLSEDLALVPGALGLS
jgi:iron uptake system component EfeO